MNVKVTPRRPNVFGFASLFVTGWATAALFGLFGQPGDVPKAAFLTLAAVLLALASRLAHARRKEAP